MANALDDDDMSAGHLLETLLAEDPKGLRVQGGVPLVCEQWCDMFFMSDAEFNAAALENACSPRSVPQASTSSFGASSGSSNDQHIATGNSAPAASLEHLKDEGRAGSEKDLPPLAWTAPTENVLPSFPGGREAESSFPASGARGAAKDSTSSKPGRGRGRGMAPSKNPSAATLAQRRYHERQKAKRLDSEKKLQEMMDQMQQLQVEKEELELRNRILTRDLSAWQDHLEEMWGNRKIRNIQQSTVIGLLADLMGRAAGRKFSIAEAESWTFEEYIRVHFQKYVDRLRELVPVALQNPDSTEHAELCALVDAYRDMDLKGGQSSCFNWGCVLYNLAETRSSGVPPPGPEFWAAVLDAAMLSEAQIDQLLSYHEKLHGMLVKCASNRNSIILPQLGLEGANVYKDQMHKCPAANALYHSYRKEQTAVLGLYVLRDMVLTKPQKVMIDVSTYPWCPQWLDMLGILRQRRGLPDLKFPEFMDRKVDLPVLPYVTAYEMLAVPIMALGIGDRMRHGVMLCPFQVVISGHCFPTAPQERLKKMTVLDIFLGRWRELTCWEWMQKVRRLDRIVPNRLLPEGGEVVSGSCGVYLVDPSGATVNNVPCMSPEEDDSRVFSSNALL